ncbi:hypothetical protein SDC9_193920 [bioreactor metagenome]|uniref:Uncharacterized protein n=1 Tax=bioreactor metagenome TaxID=1076179 RepID=A0A645IDG5_9ZZZZ
MRRSVCCWLGYRSGGSSLRVGRNRLRRISRRHRLSRLGELDNALIEIGIQVVLSFAQRVQLIRLDLGLAAQSGHLGLERFHILQHIQHGLVLLY